MKTKLHYSCLHTHRFFINIHKMFNETYQIENVHNKNKKKTHLKQFNLKSYKI